MVVHDDHVEFSFPPGTLSSVDPDSGYMFAVDMEKLEGDFAGLGGAGAVQSECLKNSRFPCKILPIRL